MERDQRVYLKVKVKSLMAEAKIIRQMASKHPAYKAGLNAHRRGTLRYEARLTHLAYGFIRGLEYKQMEMSATGPPIHWAKVKGMVERYGVLLITDKLPADYYLHRDALLSRYDAWQRRAEGKPEPQQPAPTEPVLT